MDSNRKLAELAIKNARSALENGNLPNAKKWADQASQLAPEMEDPWLVLAYLAKPDEGFKYLEKALALNPASNRAQKGIHFLIRKMQGQKLSIPSGYEKYIESEAKPPQPVKIFSGDNQILSTERRVQINEQPLDKCSEEENQKDAALEKSKDTPLAEAELISNEKKVEILAENHVTEKTELITNTANESASPSGNNIEYNAPLTFSRKQPSNFKKVDLGSVFILLFGLLILSITILVILYTNHLLPFIK